jgi:sulfate transport system substrate-binding protein
MNFSSHLRRLTFALWALAAVGVRGETRLLNASFDISRELFQAYNPVFAAHWQAQTGETVTFSQSHAGSSKQARAVIDGLAADVITFNQVTDVDQVAARGLVAKDWRTRFPHQSSPFTSTIVFLVRKGNPKAIRDWDDLARPGVSVIVPNPKTSGNGRYSYLAAYAHALKQNGGRAEAAREFVGRLFRNVPVLDTGGRGATTTFVQRGIGDVLLTFEAEVFLTLQELGRTVAGQPFEVVAPSYSVEAELPVAVVEKVAQRRGTTKQARAYLEYLSSDAGQEVAAKNYFRPRSAAVARKFSGQFAQLTLFRVDDVFGSWAEAQKTHFAEDGVFDQIYRKTR